MADTMEKISGIIRSRHESPKVCSLCNTILVIPYGIVAETSYLTDYGLLCGSCVEGYVINVYRPGEDVSGTLWYRGCYLE